MRSPVTRVGNKQALLGTICEKFPCHYKKFVDLFGGSGSVLLGKPEIAPFEVYNDVDRNLVNLFRCMKQRPMAVVRELGFCNLNSRDDFRIINKFFQHETFDDAFMKEEMELTTIMLPPLQAEELIEVYRRIMLDYDVRRGAMFLKKLRYSYASTGKSYAAQPFDIRKLFYLIQMLEDRLANVVVEDQDFATCIRHYDSPDTFFYADPPYYKSEKMYAADFGWEDHVRLRNLLGNVQGKFLLSYNDDPVMRELYEGFYIYAYTRPHSMVQHIDAGREFGELIIGNYDLFEREKAKPKQLTMFDAAGELLQEYDTFDYERVLQQCITPITKK